MAEFVYWWSYRTNRRKAVLQSVSGERRLLGRRSQLQQVMISVDQLPFGSGLVRPHKTRLVKAAGLFDMSEYGLSRLFAQVTLTSRAAAVQAPTHGRY